MNYAFAPGCALYVYKPELAKKTFDYLQQEFADLAEHQICCQHEPKLASGTRIINVCPGCNKRYKALYDGITTVTLWELLAGSKTFPFPDYNGATMTIHDACDTRNDIAIHAAIRELLKKMNITLIEPQQTRTEAFCCGNSFNGTLPEDEVKERMKKRADTMPCDEVVVYCVACARSMKVGGKRPRYLLDLLMGEDTCLEDLEPHEWKSRTRAFREAH